jgi:hypothetical protein
MIDQGWPQEESFFVPRQASPPPVDDQLGAFVDSKLDIAFDLPLVFGLSG